MKKKITLSCFILASLNVLGSVEMPHNLFGEFPAKFYCVEKANHLDCKMPNVSDIENEINFIESQVQERKNVLEHVYGDLAKKELKYIVEQADKAREEFGENKFSELYYGLAEAFEEKRLSGIVKSQRSHSDVSKDVEKDISNDSNYLNFLRELKVTISNGMTNEEYRDLVDSNLSMIKNYRQFSANLVKAEGNPNPEMSQYSGKLNKFSNTMMVKHLNLNCPGAARLGSSQTRVDLLPLNVSLDYRGEVNSKKLHYRHDRNIIEKMMTGQNGNPINVNCFQQSAGDKKFVVSYDSESKTLNIPYEREYGLAVAEGAPFGVPMLGSEIKTINNGDYVELLRKVLK